MSMQSLAKKVEKKGFYYMSNAQVLSSLLELRPHSGKRISKHVITRMTMSLSQAQYQLIRSMGNPDGPGIVTVPTNGIETLSSHTQSTRKLVSLAAGAEDNLTYSLNTALLGGESYPILTAVLGTITGAASAGAGLLFTVASTALSVSQTSKRVLARGGDELWQREEIGKVGSDVVHVGSYFLVDPFRGHSVAKGWLIHEKRTKLDV